MSHLSKQSKSLTHNIKPFINYSNLNKMKTIKTQKEKEREHIKKGEKILKEEEDF